MQKSNCLVKYDWDHEFNELLVICGHCSLIRNGLVIGNSAHLDLFTCYMELHRVETLAFTYYYNSFIDYKYEVTPSKSNPKLLLPSKERAIVECIKFLDNVDEGLLVEALKSYLDYFWDDRIYEVGLHFGVSRETLDYWFQEAKEDCEI